MRGVAIHLSYTHHIPTGQYPPPHISTNTCPIQKRTPPIEPHGRITPPTALPPLSNVRLLSGRRERVPIARLGAKNAQIFAKRRVHNTPTTTTKKNRRERAAERGYTGQRGRLIHRSYDTHARDAPLLSRTHPRRCYPAPGHIEPGTRIITRPEKSE